MAREAYSAAAAAAACMEFHCKDPHWPVLIAPEACDRVTCCCGGRVCSGELYSWPVQSHAVCRVSGVLVGEGGVRTSVAR